MKIYTFVIFQLILFVGLAASASAQKAYASKWASGQLERRTKVGVWEYYGVTASKEKVTVQRYDHSANTLVYYRPVDDIAYNTEVSAGQWKRRPVDRPPLFIGGDAALAAYTTRLQYPLQAQERNVQGQVMIGFIIDAEGKTSGHRVLRSIGGGCDQEALRVAKTIPNEWIPAMLGNQPVPVEYELTLTFRLAQP